MESRIHAASNAFRLAHGVEAEDIIVDWGGTMIHAENTLVNGRRIDVVATYNDAHDPDLAAEVGWAPELHTRIHRVELVPALVTRHAGAGELAHHRRG